MNDLWRWLLVVQFCLFVWAVFWVCGKTIAAKRRRLQESDDDT